MTKLPSCPRLRDGLVCLQCCAAKRGSLLIWLDRKMMRLAQHERRPERPTVFSEGASKFRLLIKVLFKLRLRRLAGIVASLLRMAGLDWPVPDYSTLCRRPKSLAVQVQYRRTDALLNLLEDTTGIEFLGDGEWQARKHGASGRRERRKIDLTMDMATFDVRAVEFTLSRDGDSPPLPDLIEQIPDDAPFSSITPDGAYDPRRCHTAIIVSPSTASIPIRANGRPWNEERPAALA